MTLPASGAISLSQVNTELGSASNATRNLGDTAVRTLFGVASGAISMSQGYGKSNYQFGSTWTYRSGLSATGWSTTTNAAGNCFYNGRFVIGGTSGRIAYSSDGITWTYVNTLVGQGWPSTYSQVTAMWAGTNLCMVASQNAEIGTSTDGMTWTYRSGLKATAFGAVQVMALAHSGSIWVASGAAGRIATSPDGITWTNRTGLSGTTWGTADVRDVYWDGTRFMAVGGSGKWATSTDGVTWTYQGVIAGLTTVLWGNVRKSPNGVWVAFALSNNAASSTDGINWTNRSALTGLTTGFSNGFGKAIWDGSKFLAGMGGSQGDIAYTTDGITWGKYSTIASTTYAKRASFLAKGTSNVCSVGETGACATSP